MALPYFWIFSALCIALLLYLLQSEFSQATHVDTSEFDRGVRWFNVSVLLALVVIVGYITYQLEVHRQTLDRLVTLYPSARYAPERESFGEREKWVYVSREEADAIITFYQKESVLNDYGLVTNKSGATTRLLFTQGGEQFFLTIVDEGRFRVLYYSKEGKIQVINQ